MQVVPLLAIILHNWHCRVVFNNFYKKSLTDEQKFVFAKPALQAKYEIGKPDVDFFCM